MDGWIPTQGKSLFHRPVHPKTRGFKEDSPAPLLHSISQKITNVFRCCEKNPATLIETKITWFLKSHFSLSFCFSRGLLLPESRFSALLLQHFTKDNERISMLWKNQATLVETKITWHFSGQETNCMWRKLTWWFFWEISNWLIFGRLHHCSSNIRGRFVLWRYCYVVHAIL